MSYDQEDLRKQAEYERNQQLKKMKPGDKLPFPKVGDTVIGLYRLHTDDTPPYRTHRESASRPKCTVAAVYGADSVRVRSGDVFTVVPHGDGVFKAV